GALLESGNRQWKRVEQRAALRAEAFWRDDVSLERLAGRGIANHAGGQERAEIAVAHRSGRHDACLFLDRPIALPLLAPEEEQLLLAVVERSRNVDRPTEREPVGVVGVWRFLEPGALARPRVGIERVVLAAPERVAVKALRATLGDEAQLTCRCATEL